MPRQRTSSLEHAVVRYVAAPRTCSQVEECRGSAQCCFSPEWQLQPAVDGQHNALVGSDPRWHQQRTYNLSLAGER